MICFIGLLVNQWEINCLKIYGASTVLLQRSDRDLNPGLMRERHESLATRLSEHRIIKEGFLLNLTASNYQKRENKGKYTQKDLSPFTEEHLKGKLPQNFKKKEFLL